MSCKNFIQNCMVAGQRMRSPLALPMVTVVVADRPSASMAIPILPALVKTRLRELLWSKWTKKDKLCENGQFEN